MKKAVLFGVSVGFCMIASAEPDYGTGAVAFYPFDEGEPGTEMSTSENAVDPAKFLATGFNYNLTTVEGLTPHKPVFTDDVPGKYLFASAHATVPMVSAYQSIEFLDEIGLRETNETARTVTPKNDKGRVANHAYVRLAKLMNELDRLGSYTIEFFWKQTVFVDGSSACLFNTYMGDQGDLSVLLERASSANFVRNLHLSANGAKGEDNVNRFSMSYGSRYNKLTRSAGMDLCDNRWRHLAIVHDAESAKTWVVENYSRSVPISPAHTTKSPGDVDVDSIIGDYRAFPGQPFYGKIAAFRVSSGVLGRDDLLRASDSADNRPAVAHYSFEDGQVGEELATTANAGSSRDSETGFRQAFQSDESVPAGSDVVPKKSMVYSGSDCLWQTCRSAYFAGTHTPGNYAFQGLVLPWLLDYDPATEGFTLECFFRLEDIAGSGNQCSIITLVDTNVASQISFGLSADRKQLLRWYQFAGKPQQRGNVAFPVRANPPSDGKWHHLSVVWNANEKSVQFYYDYLPAGDLLVDSGNVLAQPWYVRVNGNGGNTGWIDPINGWVDEVRISRRALAPAEMLRLRSNSGLILLFR